MAISGADLLELPTIYKAYVREYPHMVTVPPLYGFWQLATTYLTVTALIHKL